jgi:DNA invertase Pin-like site-specific DNA recombinase
MDLSVAYGYVRLTDVNKAKLQRLRRDIAVYCEREGLALAVVFADVGVRHTELVRPGWTALMDAVRSGRGRTVVVLTLDHLSRDPTLREDMRAQLGGAGAAVCVARGAR